MRTAAEHGYTFVELLVVSSIIIILASAVMPLAKVSATRQREAELRRVLREMRTAIDKYKDAADLGQIGQLEIKAGSEGYPADLQTLVDGVAAQIPAPHPRRSDDPQGRVGPARLSGRTGRDALGRPERVRRVYDV
jgi:type II secretory pathway pseudopilin PulG